MSSSLEALSSPISRGTSTSSLSSVKLQTIRETLGSLAIRKKVDFAQYNNVIQDLFASSKHIGGIGEIFETFRDEIHLSVIQPITIKHIEEAIIKSKSLGLLWKVNQSFSNTNTERETYILNSLIVWILINNLRAQYEALIKRQQKDTRLFIDLGYQIAAMLKPYSLLCKGLLLEINILEPIVEIGISHHVSPTSRSFIQMLSAVTLSHISVPLLHEGFLRLLDQSQTYRFYEKWTNLLMAYSPINHVPQSPEEPGIFKLFHRKRMLPLNYKESWPLAQHFKSVFADVQISDYIPVVAEMLVMSNRRTQNLKRALADPTYSQLPKTLNEVVKSCKNPLNQDINIINLCSLEIMEGLAKVAASNESSGVVENCKALYSIIVEQYLHYHDDFETSKGFSSAMMKALPDTVNSDKLSHKHLELLVDIIDGPESILKNAEFASLFCSYVNLVEKTAKSHEGMEVINCIMSSMHCPMTITAFISHLIFRLGQFLASDLGQGSIITIVSDLFERPLPIMTLGKYGDPLTNEKNATCYNRVKTKDELHRCMISLITVLRRSVTFCARLLLESDPNKIQTNELNTVVGALFVALDLATMCYPSVVGNEVLENGVMETFGLIAKEYREHGICLALTFAANIATASIKFSLLSGKIVEKIMAGGESDVALKNCAEVIGTTIVKIINSWDHTNVLDSRTAKEMSLNYSAAGTLAMVRGKEAELNLEEYAAWIHIPNRPKVDKR